MASIDRKALKKIQGRKRITEKAPNPVKQDQTLDRADAPRPYMGKDPDFKAFAEMFPEFVDKTGNIIDSDEARETYRDWEVKVKSRDPQEEVLDVMPVVREPIPSPRAKGLGVEFDVRFPNASPSDSGSSADILGGMSDIDKKALRQRRRGFDPTVDAADVGAAAGVRAGVGGPVDPDLERFFEEFPEFRDEDGTLLMTDDSLSTFEEWAKAHGIKVPEGEGYGLDKSKSLYPRRESKGNFDTDKDRVAEERGLAPGGEEMTTLEDSLEKGLGGGEGGLRGAAKAFWKKKSPPMK